ncbi:MAG: hypothetical protein KGN76_11985, partial [Acidobacteriota bacterium]|nr:hypothetical protein [Acidobacteriota bacterium]
RPTAPPPAPAAAWTVRHIRLPLVGPSVAYVPREPTSRVVLFISGDGGWEPRVARIAEHLAAHDIVIGVSYPALARAAARQSGCWYVASDLELLSHEGQRLLNLPQYTPPVLLGYSSGAGAVYAGLAPAPAVTFAGAVSLAFSPELEVARHVCLGDVWFPQYSAKRRTNSLPPTKTLPKDWYILQGADDKVTSPAAVSRFIEGMPRTHLIEVPRTGHGFGVERDWAAPLDQAVDALWAEAERRPAPAVPPPPAISALETSLNGLGLNLEYRMPETTPAAFMIFLSGDGGWASIDNGVSTRLAQHGIGVVGLSSLRYFWEKKTPEDVATVVGRFLDVLAAEHKPVFAGGYSFGAEVVPVSLRGWTPDERRRLAGLILLAPGLSASFEINPLDWVREPKTDPKTMVAPAVKEVGLPTLCMAGSKEDESGCTAIEGTPGMDVVHLPGGHHFGDDYDALTERILTFIHARTSATGGF